MATPSYIFILIFIGLKTNNGILVQQEFFILQYIQLTIAGENGCGSNLVLKMEVSCIRQTRNDKYTTRNEKKTFFS